MNDQFESGILPFLLDSTDKQLGREKLKFETFHYVAWPRAINLSFRLPVKPTL